MRLARAQLVILWVLLTSSDCNPDSLASSIILTSKILRDLPRPRMRNKSLFLQILNVNLDFLIRSQYDFLPPIARSCPNTRQDMTSYIYTSESLLEPIHCSCAVCSKRIEAHITRAIVKHHTRWRRVHIVRHSSAGAGILHPGPHAIPPNQTSPLLRVGAALTLDIELSLMTLRILYVVHLHCFKKSQPKPFNLYSRHSPKSQHLRQTTIINSLYTAWVRNRVNLG
jgi:hypothetical protein